MKITKHILQIGALACALLLSLSGCSPEDLVGMDQEDRSTLPGEALLSPHSTDGIIPISGQGFKMEVLQEADQSDQVTVRFFTSEDMLTSVDHGIIIELGSKLHHASEVKMTVMDQAGDVVFYPKVELGFRKTSVVFIDLDPDLYQLDANYGLKFILEIDNQGLNISPGDLIYRVGGGHIMAENIDGRQLYLSTGIENAIFKPEIQGDSNGNSHFGNSGNLGQSGDPGMDATGQNPADIIQGDDKGIEAPIPNNHGGHIMVENIDGRQILMSPTRKIDE